MNDKIRLFILSFLMLFVELALIRWLGSNIVFLSYFSNFVLLGSFLGIGIGFIFWKSEVNLFQWSPILLAMLVLFVTKYPVRIEYGGNDLLIFSPANFRKTGFPIWLTLPIIFLAVTATMATIAQGVAETFAKFKPLLAYRLDILGALAGIVTFTGLSFLNTSPIYWGSIVCCIYLLILFSKKSYKNKFILLQLLALFLLFNTLIIESLMPTNFWSPYYKISLLQTRKSPTDNYVLSVNGIPHQEIISIQQRKIQEPFYWFPYAHRIQHSPPTSLLIIGSGTGTDAAIALSKNVKSIDAVEIDPMIYQLGHRYHPDQPYSNPHVHIIIDDGRAFLQRTDHKYDMILFALTDSQTLISGHSSLRLESFIYTREAMLAVKNHLNPNGVFATYNYYNQPWLVDRLARTMHSVFKQTPCMDTYGQHENWRTVLTVSTNPSALHCPHYWSTLYDKNILPATDDHPFLYLQKNNIPPMYAITLLLILMTALCITRLMSGSLTAIKNYLDLFFMGAAFLLLETKSLASFALLFGITWLVNAMVFGGILLSVYAAIEVIHRVKKPLSLTFYYGLLLFFLILAWLIPINILLYLNPLWRFIIASVLIFMPIFLANLIFANRFQHTLQSTTAFGVNLIGAMLGGVLEYSAMIIGYRNLLIVIALFYTFALLQANVCYKKMNV